MEQEQERVADSAQSMYHDLVRSNMDDIEVVLRDDCGLSPTLYDPVLNGIATAINADMMKALGVKNGDPMTEDQDKLLQTLIRMAVAGFVVGALAQRGTGEVDALMGDGGIIRMMLTALATQEPPHSSHRSHGSQDR